MAEKTSDLKWRAALELFTIIGVPTAAGLAFIELVRSHPLKTICVLILYEILLFIAGFIAKVWGKLETPLVDKVAFGIQDRIERASSSAYEAAYFQHLIYRHRTFDVKGLGTQGTYTLQMEQVFVDLSIVPQPAHNVTSNAVGARNGAIPGKRYSILDLLTKTASLYPGIAIIGPPGSGKTTLLKHVTLKLAQRESSPDRHTIPILLFLREHSELIAKAKDTLLSAVIDTSLAATNCIPPPGWFGRRLNKGQCVVMLDGLDEVPDPEMRKQVANWLDNAIAEHPLNRFIVTSRPFGYKSNPISRVNVFEVRPFSPAQVRQFVYNWYLANEIMAAGSSDPGVQMAAKTGSDDLLLRLQKNQDLAELAVNPLLLTMIATVHRFRSSLPGRRVELYSEMCDVFLGNRQRAKGVPSLDLMPGQKRRVLEPLAYEMMCRKSREIGLDDLLALIKDTLAAVSKTITPNEFLSDIQDLSGVLVERENSVYSFAHLTFQEYLAAAHIRAHRLEQEILEHIHESWWHEVLRLYSAQGDASPIILACLQDEQPSIEALTLATQCMEEAFEINPELRDRLDRVLATAAGGDARRLLAQQRLKIRLRKLYQNEERCLSDDSLVTCAEYQLFLDDFASSGSDLTPEHWPAPGYLSEIATKPAQGIRASDALAFCAWLTNREERDCLFRLPTKAEAASNPIRVVAQRTPLFYWATNSRNEELVSATEFEIPYSVDILGTLTADLDLLVRDQLALAGAIEYAHESWTPANFDGITPEQLLKPIRLGAPINLDSIANVENLDDPPVFSGSYPPIFSAPQKIVALFAHSARLAAACETSRGTNQRLWQAYASTVAKLITDDKPSDAEALVLDLLWRLTHDDERFNRAARAQGLAADLSSLGTTIKARSERRAGLGQPLQGSTHRYKVATRLAGLFPDECVITERILEWRVFNNNRRSCNRRAHLRLLIIATAWLLVSRSTDPAMKPYTGVLDPERLKSARALTQLFVDLAILEETISVTGNAAESIRIVREMRSDNLATLYDQQLELQKAKYTMQQPKVEL